MRSIVKSLAATDLPTPLKGARKEQGAPRLTVTRKALRQIAKDHPNEERPDLPGFHEMLPSFRDIPGEIGFLKLLGNDCTVMGHGS